MAEKAEQTEATEAAEKEATNCQETAKSVEKEAVEPPRKKARQP